MGELVFGDRAGGDATVVPITVLEVEPPRRFSFRWTHGPDEVAAEGNSLLVTFDLVPSTDGTTTVRMSETGFRERGWEVAVLEEQYREHCVGWDHYLPVLDGYLARLVGTPMSVAVDDDLWSAIGDPTRRRLLDLLLADAGGTATTLSEQLPVTRQAVTKHLGVLDRVGLVHATPSGREKRYGVDEAQLARAVAQLSSVGSTWDARLRRIKRIAEALQQTREP